MSVVEKDVLLTVRLPHSAYQRISEAASRSHRSVEVEVAERLITTLTEEGTVDDAFDQAYESYLTQMRERERVPLSTSELWDQMHSIREQVANELHSQ